jgi:hypothetical protein
VSATPAVSVAVWVSGVGVYVVKLSLTLAAVTVYVPSGSVPNVVVAVTVWLKLFGPVTVTAPMTPLGNPVTATVRDPSIAA